MTLRTRLLAAMALVAVVLVATAVVIARSAESYLVGQVDDELEAARGSVDTLVANPSEDEADTLSDLFVAIAIEEVVFVRARPSLDPEPPPIPDITPAEARDAVSRDGARTIGGDGPRYRILATPLAQPAGGVLVLGLPLDQVDQAVDRLVLVEALATLTILAVLALVTWWVQRLGVRPVKQMAGVAGAIRDGDLSQRVPEGDPHTEVGALGEALNAMLGEIERSFDERRESEERLRRFAADASHELRTPVTTIRGYAELYRTGALEDPEALDDAMRRTEEEATRMGALVDDLLRLARLDQARLDPDGPLRHDVVALDRVVADAVADAHAVDPDRLIAAELSTVEVTGDEGALRQVVANLLTNALRHTPAGTAVRVTLSREGTRAVLEVADDGPGMEPEAAAQAFERFYRADPGRARGGSGLGLAIVDAIARAHGGVATLDSAPGKGTTVRIELPAHDDAGEDDGVTP